MEAVYLKENFRISWVSETGIIENMERLVEEYKLTRDLLVRLMCSVFSVTEHHGVCTQDLLVLLSLSVCVSSDLPPWGKAPSLRRSANITNCTMLNSERSSRRHFMIWCVMFLPARSYLFNVLYLLIKTKSVSVLTLNSG